MFENDLKHVYTQYTQGAASNGSLSRDMAAEPALEACHRGTCQGRHERPARARASARTARHAGRRRPHLAESRGHLPRVETGPDAACVHSQGADEQVRAENTWKKKGEIDRRSRIERRVRRLRRPLAEQNDRKAELEVECAGADGNLRSKSAVKEQKPVFGGSGTEGVH